MLIDTHCHITLLIDGNDDKILSDQDYAKAQDIIAQSKNSNVTTIITIGSTNRQDSINSSLLAKKFDSVFAAVGIFPHDAKPSWQEDLKSLIPLIKENEKIIAIGECGLDFHYPDFNINRQKDVFRAQIELALQYNKALIIHTRQATEETLRIIDSYKSDLPAGVFHCFSENLEFAQYVINLGFYLGIPATITYPKNNSLREIVRTIGMEHCVLETDAPFLPPQHMRGKPNHPQQIATIAEYIAHMFDKSVQYIAHVTTNNARKLFNLPRQ